MQILSLLDITKSFLLKKSLFFKLSGQHEFWQFRKFPRKHTLWFQWGITYNFFLVLEELVIMNEVLKQCVNEI